MRGKDAMFLNEKIILPVFHQMMRFDKRLAFLLPEDGEEEPDMPRLADEIVRRFPWPIGVEFRRLFAVGYDSLNYDRLYQILKIVERILQFVSFMLLSQMFEEGLNRRLLYPDDFRKNFKTRFSTLTLGTCIWLIRSVGRIFKDNRIEPFAPEMETVLSKKSANKLEPWAHIRNEISHYLVNLSQEEIQKRCLEYQDNLIETLNDICFIIKYPLVTITNIQVEKYKRRPPSFSHAIKKLPNFADKPRVYDSFTDSRSVLLLKEIKNAPTSYLNLSPFILDTHTENLDTKEKKDNIKMDIFMYSKYDRDERIHYIGANVGDICDMRYLSNYEDLHGELKEFFNLLEPEETL